MPRPTTYHGWPVQEPKDADYPETFARLVNSIDREVIRKGPVDTRPPPGRRGRWFLATDSPPTMYYDTGSRWEAIHGDVDLPPTLTLADAEELITGQWTFTEPLNASITGEAASAAEAEVAGVAENAQQLDGRPAEDYLRTDQDERVKGQFYFLDEVAMSGGLRITGGTLDMPRTNGRPPVEQRGKGSMWFDLQEQPSGE